MNRHRALLLGLMVMFLASCGAASTGTKPLQSVTSKVSTRAATPVTPSPINPSATNPNPKATASPVPATPPPLRALLAYLDAQGVAHAVDAQGHQHFQVPLSAAIGRDAQFYVGGAHLLVEGDGKVLVFDRDGRVIGGGLAEANHPTLFPAPDGTRWAWLHDTTNYSASPGAPEPTSIGTIRVAGIGDAPHTVSSFSLPPDASGLGHTERIYQWSDRGIVTAILPQICGDLREDSTALLNPNTGRSTPLYGNDRHLVDVHAGVTVGYTITYANQGSTNTVLVGGSAQFKAVTVVTTSLHIESAFISPDGAHVAVGYTGLAGCGGQWIGATELITVATHAKNRISTLESIGWLDDQTMVAQPVVEQPCQPQSNGNCAHQPHHLDLIDLQGNWKRIVDDGAYLGTIH